MPEESYKTVTDLLTRILQQSAAGAGKGFALDGIVDSVQELRDKTQGRSQIIDKLKQKMGGGDIKAKDWCPLIAQIDFLSRLERDIEMRFMSRVGSFRRRTNAHKLGVSSIEVADKILSKNEKG